MQIVATDIVGPLPESDGGNSYILVVGDYFTKWMEAFPIPNQDAITVANKLVNEVFLMFAIPEQLHSDQGRQFESRFLSEVCKLLGIYKTRTTPYHPQCNGLVERFNRTLLNMLSTCVGDYPFDWEHHLRKVCMAYNSGVQMSTGYTPFYLMFGRKARLPLDIMYGTNQPTAVHSMGAYAMQLQNLLLTAYDLVRDHITTQHQRQKTLYDKKVHGKSYKLGDLVWLHSPVPPRGSSHKLYHPWTGPFKVVKKLSEVTYRVQQLQGLRTRKVVHFDHLKPCRGNVNVMDSHSPVVDETSLANMPAPSQQAETDTPSTSEPYGTNLELIDNDDTEDAVIPILLPTTDINAIRRYPVRERRPPTRLNDYVQH